ncbi:uncharacterized protein LOC117262140 isoform X1 [Epinephelus lanceolatus]
MPPRRNRGPGGQHAWRADRTGAEFGVTAMGHCQRGCHQRIPQREAPCPQWLAMNLMSCHLMAAGTVMRAQAQKEQREQRERRQKEKKENKAAAQKAAVQKQAGLETQRGQTKTQATQTEETQAPERDQPLGRPGQGRPEGPDSTGGGIKVGVIAAVLLTLLLILAGVKQSEGVEQGGQGQEQVGECAVALGTIAAKQGKIPYREIVSLTYYKSHAYVDILVEGSGGIGLHGRSIGPRCSAEGKVTARVMCDMRGGTDTDTGRSIPLKVAHQWLQLDPVPQRKSRAVRARRVEVIRTTTWKSNKFYQWLEYSAKQVTNSLCIACHRNRGLPRVRPLPDIEECARTFFCFTQCTMWMAAGRGKHTNNTAICPVSLKGAPEPIKQEYQVPPVVHLAQDIVFPFCIARGEGIESVLDNSTSLNATREAEVLIQCRHENITNDGVADSRRQEKICNTTEEAKIQCGQVISGASKNSTIW